MSYFQNFKADIKGIELPEKFTFPFYYEPHELTKIAASELQEYLSNQNDFVYNFGMGETDEGFPQGKMFGVLVVKNSNHEIGYLAAFSGSLTKIPTNSKFVPPVLDINKADSFYKIGEAEIDKITLKIDKLENDPKYIALLELLESKTIFINNIIVEEKNKLKEEKKKRKLIREENKDKLLENEFKILNDKLIKESNYQQWLFKELSDNLINQLNNFKKEVNKYSEKINELKNKRKNMSNNLQYKIFDNYHFFNINKSVKKLTEIFPDSKEQKPPAGSGDCATPKLLQYAFANDLKPLCMGEFWWGASPLSEVRKHKVFYPSCNNRCKPILAHMLDGMNLDADPFINHSSSEKEIDIIHEDDEIIIINKPHDFLSVPGKELIDSVQTRMEEKYPDAKGHLTIHRLDMATSGILVLAKTKETHKFMQSQFIEKTLTKRYVALIDGVPNEKEGMIDLPLRVDLNDRPRQMVCYDYGKPSKTKWKLIKTENGKSLLHLYPITGRTHQLRVHLSHPLGLNIPIVGDDLYGTKSDRLYLHAEFIEFIHPKTRRKFKIQVDSGF